jgi:hypothetical protein
MQPKAFWSHQAQGIFVGHFCRSFLVIENCILTQILTQLQWEYYQQLVVGIYFYR